MRAGTTGHGGDSRRRWPPPPWLPWLLALAAYLATYGLSVLVSLDILIRGYTAAVVVDGPIDRSLGVVLRPTGLGLALAAVAVLLTSRAAAREWLIGRPRPPRGAGVITAAATIGALLAGYWLMLATGIPQNPAATADGGPLGYQLVRSVAAGVGEELIVLALPVVLLRHTAPAVLRRRAGLVAVVGGLVLLRMAYHLYYEEWAAALLPWALATALVYLWAGRVWPLVLTHASYNAVLSLHEHDLLGQPVMLLILTAAVLLCVSAARAAWAHCHRPLASSAEPRHRIGHHP